MSAASARFPAVTTSSVVMALAPLVAAVLVVFLITGLAIPVLPLHVHHGLGFGTFVVGLVTGCQFATALISRIWSGHYADTHGAKRAVVAGLVAAAASGLLYVASLRFVAAPLTSVAILVAGRALLGGAESFIVTGVLSWGLALVAPENSGKVIAWIGTAMYAAFTVGAPLGSAIYATHGFLAIALATTVVPLAVVPFVLSLRPVAPLPRTQPPLSTVIGAVLEPAIGLAFASLAFGAVMTFSALYFVARDWTPAWLALTAFTTAFMVTRIAFGHLPDKCGGAKVALISIVLEAAGLALMWLAPWSSVAVTGAVLTGLGYALVYPGLGVEAVRHVPPQSRGLAMGTYTAFFDLGVGVSSPLLGLIAAHAGLSAVFLASTLVVLCATIVAARLLGTAS